MKKFKLLILLTSLLTSLFFSCTKNDDGDSGENVTPNILLIIADDLGKDALNGFSEGTIKAATPHLDSIRNSGLTFINFWVNPTCSPTRATIITGKYGYRTGVKTVGDALDPSETSLQKYISDQTNSKYATAIIGKWHLSEDNSTANPEAFGIDHYAGLIRGAVTDYYRWQLFEDGTNSLQTKYSTEVFTDLSIEWIQDQTKPWFLWLAYNAPHTPFHVPPDGTHQQGNLVPYTTGADAIPYYMASIESMDYHIGKLLDNISQEEKNNLIIIFIGDNGVPNQVAQSPYTSTTVKNTLYQGGINTPLFVAGKGVTRTGIDENLINGTDLFATIAELAGARSNQIHDSKSIKSVFSNTSKIRNFQYSEMTDGSEESWTIRNDRYKLLYSDMGTSEMYDLINDPYEKNNLLIGTLSNDAANAKVLLEAELLNIRK